MQDLPRTTENGKYSLAELRWFDRYRKYFRKTVEQFRPWSASCRLDTVILSCGSNVPKIDGPLTALYVPTTLDWITVRLGRDILAHLNGPPAPLLEEMLRQSREMPAAQQLPLEDLLFLARTAQCPSRHRRDAILTIDGQDYARWVFCEPYLPQLKFSSLTLEVPISTVVYAETATETTCPEKEKDCIRNLVFVALRDGVFFVTDIMPGIAVVSDGMFLRICNF